MNQLLEIVSVVLVGLVAGAEQGSWCCVQPVVDRLPYEHYVAVEQAMLRTFGRIMPILMPLSGILTIALVIASRGQRSIALWLRAAAAVCIAVTVVTTLAVNVPINSRTAAWPVSNDPADWQRMRTRWHFYQGVRGALFLSAFVLLTIPLVRR